MVNRRYFDCLSASALCKILEILSILSTNAIKQNNNNTRKKKKNNNNIIIIKA